MAKILYANKVALDDDPDIAEINKVTAENMNVLKGGINDLLTALGLEDSWIAGASYVVGNQVIHNGIIYECTTANSDTTFTPSHWKVVPLLVAQTTSTSAKANTLSEEE